MLLIALVLFVIGIVAIGLSVEAEVDTHTFWFRLFVVCALTLLVVPVTSMVPQ